MKDKEWSEVLISETEQRRWDSYKIWKKCEYYDSATNDQKLARGLLFEQLIPKLEGLLTAVPAK